MILLFLKSLHKYKHLWRVDCPEWLTMWIPIACGPHFFLPPSGMPESSSDEAWGQGGQGQRPEAKFLCSHSALQGKKQNGLSQSTPRPEPAWPKCMPLERKGASRLVTGLAQLASLWEKTIQISLQLVVREVTMSSGPKKNKQFLKC